ncbi:MAG TPA: selenocysteine-specific translation elongation factor [Bryobacteraceae bacterium]|jgi:selenocysteine-specific elongation factor|nr:selenocysteine-specific translation elongation factor [Bryobacteraceae bacterium]
MRHIIVGTAGHIDHGKTALVKALTGADTDRLAEEKRRGISIDLGFAHLDIGPDLRLGFIDVPGHERFVKNMLAGASGIDLVLMVVAAGESIMPQTREHFEICRLLGLSRGVIAITKSDIVDADLLDLTRLEVEEFVAGSFLENAPTIAVSSITGAGITELRDALASIAYSASIKDTSNFFRLPIDRSFSMRGHGSVVTGTLIAGTLKVEDEVELFPANKRARVRGLQIHGAPSNQASAGERTAVNLAGVDSAEIQRGMVLAPPGLFHSTTRIDTTFELLPGAHPLKHRAPVHFHAGTAEVEAEARLLASLEPMKPGSRAHVRFLLEEPLLILPGDRFIVRMFSPVVTIGGGVVLDAAPPSRLRRAALNQRLDRIEKEGLAAVAVNESAYGLTGADLVARCGVRFAESWYPNSAKLWSFKASASDILAHFHAIKPLLAGMPKEELRNSTLPGSPPFLLDELLRRVPEIKVEGEIVRLASHRVLLKTDETEATKKIEGLFQDAGLAVPSIAEVLSKSGIEPARSRALLQILFKERKLIKINDELVFHASAIEALRAILAARVGTKFSVADFKAWTAVSRKYAIPLLEFLDREHVTRREGDNRIVLDIRRT